MVDGDALSLQTTMRVAMAVRQIQQSLNWVLDQGFLITHAALHVSCCRQSATCASHNQISVFEISSSDASSFVQSPVMHHHSHSHTEDAHFILRNL